MSLYFFDFLFSLKKITNEQTVFSFTFCILLPPLWLFSWDLVGYIRNEKKMFCFFFAMTIKRKSQSYQRLQKPNKKKRPLSWCACFVRTLQNGCYVWTLQNGCSVWTTVRKMAVVSGLCRMAVVLPLLFLFFLENNAPL